MFKKKQETAKDTQEQAKVYEPEFSWETSRIAMIEKSEHRAWTTVKVLGACFVLSVAALALLMPLKTVEPFVIKIDESKGLTEVLHIANASDIPASEMMDKYWLSRYVQTREGYDWRTLHVDFLNVRELSMPNVFDPYAAQYGVDNKNSIESLLKDDKRIRVRLAAIVINHPAPDGVATVRFTKELVNNKTQQVEARNSWVATIGYEYYPDFRVEEERRLINPFGFKITSYRVDPEMSGAGR